VADGDAGPPGFDSPLDDRFVEGARFQEPSARERAEQARAFQRHGKAAARRNRRARGQGRLRKLLPWALLAAAVLVVWFLFGRGGSNSTSSAFVEAPNELTAVYAIPSDVNADATVPDAIRHELTVVDDWFENQTADRLRIERTDGVIDVEEVPLTVDAATLVSRADAAGLVRDEFAGRLQPGHEELLVVFVPVEFETQVRCGEGSADGFAVVWMGSCQTTASTSSQWPDPLPATLAHELVHTMGAVEACAPNYGNNGHVVDNPNDLMYDGPRRAEGDLVLDPGNDDYYDHDDGGCWDVKDHPLWD
jgi:hypothetical protein